MKRLMIAILFLSSLSGFSQRAVRLGANITTMTKNDDPNSSSGFLVRPSLSYVGNPVRLGDGLYFDPEYTLAFKGRSFKYDYTFTSDGGTQYIRKSETKWKFTYFEVPFMFSKGLGEKVSFNFGPYLGFRISGRISGTTQITQIFSGGGTDVHNIDEDVKFSHFADGTDARRPINQFDGGVIAGIEYHLNDGINIGLRYQYGLLDITKDNYPTKQTDISTETFQIIQISASYYLGD